MSNAFDVAKTYQQMTEEKQAVVDYSINIAMGFPDTEKLDIMPVFNTMSDDEKLVLFYLTDQALQASVNHDFLRDSEYIKHYGVKGQRWGFRKATTRGGTPASKRKAKGEVDEGENSSSKRVQTPSHKSKTKDLSDQELKDRIQRLQNERLYAQLTAKPENVVVGIIKRSAKKSAEEALTQVSTKLLKQALGAGADKLLSKKASETIKNTSMDDFSKVFAEAKKSAPKFKVPEAPKPGGPAGKSNFGTSENPIFFTATRSDPTPRPTIKLKEITR